MAKANEFLIEKVVIKVPRDFVDFGGVRYQWDDWQEGVATLKELDKGPKSTERLERQWLVDWEKLGVIHSFNMRVSDQYQDEWVEMIERGHEYEHFMQAVSGFEGKLEAEREEAARETRRKQIKAELAGMDAPADKIEGTEIPGTI